MAALSRRRSPVEVGQELTYGTVFYEDNPDDGRDWPKFPGDDIAKWVCEEQVHKDNKGQFSLVAYEAIQASGRGDRTYVWAKFRRIR